MHSRFRSSKYSCSHSQQPLLSGTRGRAAQGKERDTFTRKSPAPPFQVIEYCDVLQRASRCDSIDEICGDGRCKESKTRLCKALSSRREQRATGGIRLQLPDVQIRAREVGLNRLAVFIEDRLSMGEGRDWAKAPGEDRGFPPITGDGCPAGGGGREQSR